VATVGHERRRAKERCSWFRLLGAAIAARVASWVSPEVQTTTWLDFDLAYPT